MENGLRLVVQDSGPDSPMRLKPLLHALCARRKGLKAHKRTYMCTHTTGKVTSKAQKKEAICHGIYVVEMGQNAFIGSCWDLCVLGRKKNKQRTWSFLTSMLNSQLQKKNHHRCGIILVQRIPSTILILLVCLNPSIDTGELRHTFETQKLALAPCPKVCSTNLYTAISGLGRRST